MKIKILYLFVFLLGSTTLFSQWSSLTDFPGTARRGSVGFMIGEKLYVCTGSDSDSLRSDLWEYDTANDLWSRKANFPAAARWDASGFSIGTKGYVGTGYTGSTYKKDFWEYDPASDSWTQKANFGGPASRSAVGFNIGDKGYIGTGYSTPAGTYYKDFWEYDAVNNVWNQKTDFPGTARDMATGFAIGEKGYIGMGHDINGNYYKDLWEYDPAGNSWLQKPYLTGEAREGAIGFSIGSKGYVGSGLSGDFPYYYHNDLWEFDPVTDTWTQADVFSGAGIYEAVGVSDGANGYIVTGQADDGYTKELWKFAVETGIVFGSGSTEDEFSVYPNPSFGKIVFELENYKNSEIEIFNSNGQLVKSVNLKAARVPFSVNSLVKGTYFVKMKNKNGTLFKKFIKL